MRQSVHTKKRKGKREGEKTLQRTKIRQAGEQEN